MEANNMMAMRDALLKVKRLFDGRIMFQQAIREAHEALNAALATHPRNCDIGTAEEQAEKFKKFCYIYPLNCAGCPFKNIANTHNDCAIFWAQMPYESEVKE